MIYFNELFVTKFNKNYGNNLNNMRTVIRSFLCRAVATEPIFGIFLALHITHSKFKPIISIIFFIYEIHINNIVLFRYCRLVC